MTAQRSKEPNEQVPASPDLRLAASARTARPGELVAVDSRGREVSRFSLHLRPVWLGAILGILSAPFMLLDLAELGFGMTAAGVVGLVLAHRAQRPYLQAQSRLVAGDLAGAEAILARLATPARGPRARHRLYIEGYLAYARGHDREAIQIFERGLPQFKRRDFRRTSIEAALVELYVRTGEIAEARRLRDRITPPGPGADMIALSLAGADLVLASAEGRERELPEDDLQRWTRLALELNHSSLTLAALARVFAARGDDELADHLAREARDRFSWCPLECTPALARWIDERIARAPAAHD
ncbi:hypothetical protein [Nannocystis punicea]|uniref:Tetratricopeptide repeat protein n=1 Tax=Nannocystis punicea TaxID=2995304 RepID=A0ABY7H4M5_9BACT|nr:hypothetical protein [Nannocystis poenicansa]WAS94228.1 hypothetical protein O0S08_49530 [Nannocystis poenicansa]